MLVKKIKYLGGPVLGKNMLEVGKVYKTTKGLVIDGVYIEISGLSKLLIYKEELKYFEVIE